MSEMKIRRGKTTYGEFQQEKKDSGITEFYDALYEDRSLLHKNITKFLKKLLLNEKFEVFVGGYSLLTPPSRIKSVLD